VNDKHLKRYSIPNLTGILFTTNNKFTGLYLPPDDGRHDVLWTNKARETWPDGYFSKLWAWYQDDNGLGFAHVAAHLRGLDLDHARWDPKAPPPHTAAFHLIFRAKWPASASIGTISSTAATDADAMLAANYYQPIECTDTR
jgi:hypothetical protein